ncbi:MAG: glycosyltransferase family 2 protein [Fibrobacter sp.]|nr:glycosyltransferase family 2 protein [Fibrobacter sp.]
MSSGLSVILVNFKNAAKTISCIQALDNQSLLPDCIYIIDNASGTADREKFENTFGAGLAQSERGIPLQWIWNEQNLGFAAACNQGIRLSQACGFKGYIWLLNNDTQPEANALENILKKAKETGAGITGSLILDASGNVSGGVCRIHPKFASVRRVKVPVDSATGEIPFDYVEGSSFLLSPECIDKVGLLPEDYFLYFEEADYCTKAKQFGFKMAWARDSIVYHDIASSTKSESRQVPFFIDCLMLRNRIHFAKKYGFPKWGYTLGLLLSFVLRIKRGEWKHIPKILSIIRSKANYKKFILQNGGFIHDENL